MAGRQGMLGWHVGTGCGVLEAGLMESGRGQVSGRSWWKGRGFVNGASRWEGR